ncbi:MAG: hypothetical protein OEN55_07320 [Alphaproteobacteria bacterium]|nr:hypothetical protein [Alphaproteobacteria bacterium]
MKQLLVAMIVIFGFASPVLAAHCPKDANLIKEALAGQSNDEAKALLDKGVALHSSGNHKESLDALHEAMKLLGIAH